MMEPRGIPEESYQQYIEALRKCIRLEKVYFEGETF